MKAVWRVGAATIALGLLASCTANSAQSGTVAQLTSTTISNVAPTIPSPTTELVTTTPTPATQPPSTIQGPVVPSDTTLPGGLTTTTAGLVTTTTVPHGLGVVTTTNVGEPIPEPAAATASNVYEAAIRRDYARLAFIIGDNRFHWGFVGDRKPAESWEKDFADGTGDAIPLIIKLLETRPGIDGHGAAVWPSIAIKDPNEWTVDDEAIATALGFTADNIAQTKLKGRYLEYRFVVSAEGAWTGFYLGD